MTWKTLRDVQIATRIEFAPWLARKHCFVRNVSGTWSRVLGSPAPSARWICGRIYHAVQS